MVTNGMIELIWKNGYRMEFRAGANVVGIIRNGQRPVSVEFSRLALLQVFNAPSVGYAQGYLTSLVNCLALENQYE